jgi:hypothetical protein
MYISHENHLRQSRERGAEFQQAAEKHRLIREYRHAQQDSVIRRSVLSRLIRWIAAQRSRRQPLPGQSAGELLRRSIDLAAANQVRLSTQEMRRASK